MVTNDLLSDIPDVSVSDVQSHQAVVDRHFMEGSALLVPEECVRYPDPTPGLTPQSELPLTMTGILCVLLVPQNQPWILPRLA